MNYFRNKKHISKTGRNKPAFKPVDPRAKLLRPSHADAQQNNPHSVLHPLDKFERQILLRFFSIRGSHFICMVKNFFCP